MQASGACRATEAALKRLGTDHIDLYQIHQPDTAVPIGDTLAALDGLVQRGLRHGYFDERDAAVYRAAWRSPERRRSTT